MALPTDTLDDAIVALVAETRELVHSTQHESRLERDRPALPVFRTHDGLPVLPTAPPGPTTPALSAYDHWESTRRAWLASRERLEAIEAQIGRLKGAQDALVEALLDHRSEDGRPRPFADLRNLLGDERLRRFAAVDRAYETAWSEYHALKPEVDRLGEARQSAYDRYQVVLRTTH